MVSVAVMDVLRCDAVWFGVAVTGLLPHCWCGSGKASITVHTPPSVCVCLKNVRND
jgi:hypothetical protein